MPIAITLHVLAAVIWVGGMFFAYVALRPAAAAMFELPQRAPLWSRVLVRFFPWVWAAVIVLPATGYWMILWVFEGFANVKLHVHIMQATGVAMILIFLYIYFLPYQRMQRALAADDFPAAGRELGRIRRLVGLNLVFGLITIADATGGAYWW
ncbi:MAG: hypothetical protein A3B81_03995 [Candidatus Muproteobacteria bacterium RIFCSPHIGHO2_02_FULL_65_16]|uniref:Copper resistance protein D domain-containing protein n=1 Tax=Candidatus Muproteobacteria bacterium RIFCSPHIGHO2_02_FULL_65_16 TaxID=1817766 RepID=A0A1F6U4P9_9PROT|nr:MAG: hypothetical protein A3B81_03995 [Candidatus Muproteobacteria bacterium RIFCSPHIGHO2_02_FULL_65_16]